LKSSRVMSQNLRIRCNSMSCSCATMPVEQREVCSVQRRQSNLMGLGAYSISEAALLTRSHPKTLYSWFKRETRKSSRSVFESDYTGSEFGRTISFFDLVDAKIAVELRHKGVSMQKVRKVYEKLTSSWNVSHPFCYRRFYVATGEVFAEIDIANGGKMFVEVLTEQGFDQTVMKPFLRNLEFNQQTEKAERWIISEGIVLDPEVRFGEPLVRDSRIPAELVAGSFYCEGKDERFTAELYGLSVQDVRNAVSFCEVFGRRAA